MDGLRWLLLLFGLAVVAGVYFYSRRQRDRSESGPPAPAADAQARVEPSFESISTDSTAEPEPELQVDSGDEPEIQEVEEPAATAEQKIVTLRVIAPANSMFRGDELALSLRGIGMRHGNFGIFHRHEGNDEDKVIFSAASLVEPGSFDLTNLKEQEIPGISLFMVLPGPVEGAQAFDLMMIAARALAQSLNAELLDESGSTLSIQRERYMREEIIQFEHANLVA